MSTPRELEPLVVYPREDLAKEYKSWLDLTNEHDKATLAKAAIALANHGGGFIVLGFEEQNQNLVSSPYPAGLPPVTQDSVNSVIRRYADPEFHCQVHNVSHPAESATHIVIAVPSSLTVPVMSRRDCQNVIAQDRCYIRKPGPRSEVPNTSEEWRTLLDRCVRASRNDMLEAIRGIVLGSVTAQPIEANILDALKEFCGEAYTRWEELTAQLASDSPERFPHGYYEIGMNLINAVPAASLPELRQRYTAANRIQLTGWPMFLEPIKGSPDPYHDVIEAWIGAESNASFRASAYCDFWRISLGGSLYTIRGYYEDYAHTNPGQVIDVALPVCQAAEGMLFASRLAETFENVEGIAVRCRFTGLQGRKLHSLSGPQFPSGPYLTYENRMNKFTMQGEFTLVQVQDNFAEVLHSLLADFYAGFNFFDLRIEFIQNEINKLRRSTI